MQLPGQLASTTLGDVLGALYRERVSGVLELQEHGGVRHQVRLSLGHVTDVDSCERGPRLGDVLARLLGMSPERRRRIEQCSLEGRPQRLGSVLLERRVISKQELLRGLRVQINHRLERLYALADARILFRVSRPDGLERPRLSPIEVLTGRPRARETLKPRGRDLGASAPMRDARRQALSVLGLADDADRALIHATFRRLAAAYHPDRLGLVTTAEHSRAVREFSRLTTAYHRLVS